MSQASRTNVRRYLPFQISSGIYAWMPIFFLYFNSLLELREVLLLEAVYYAAVVALEVPSGYFSDRFGRCRTLRISTGLLTLAYVLFVFGESFAGLACAQIALAAGLAFHSGTDTSFHFDSLEDIGNESEYGWREARVASWLLIAGAAAGIVGGALSLIDFRLAYGLSGLGALCAFLIAWTFREPSSHGSSANPLAETFGSTLREIGSYLRLQPLRWLFAFFVVATAINHVPYEFYQPILRDLDLTVGSISPSTLAPLLAGLHLALTQLVAAPFAGISQRMANRFGIVPWLLASIGLQSGLIAAMALWVHPAVALLLLARSVPGAMQRAPIRAVITPRLQKRHRATFHSIMSLAGRLAFALLLAGLALIEDMSLMGMTGLRLCLTICTLISILACAILAATSKRPTEALADHP